MIDRAFKHRLISKLCFSSPDSELQLFGDNSDEWSVYKDELEAHLSDSAVHAYLEKVLLSSPKDKQVRLLNQQDKFGFTLCHYFCYFGFVQSLGYLKEHGASLGVKAKGGLLPIHLAVAGTGSEVAQFLLSAENQREASPETIDFKVIEENKERIEKFLRKISLNESLNSSNLSQPSVPFDEEEEDDGELLKSLYTLLSAEPEPNRPSHLTQARIEEEIEKREFLNRRKRRRDLERQKKLRHTAAEANADDLLERQFKYSGSQEQVMLIQKNVRGWLLRRQYHDTKFAVKILQSHFKELYLRVRDGEHKH